MTSIEKEQQSPECIVEGWLNVWEVDAKTVARLQEMGWMSLPIWEPHFCVLSPHDTKLRHFRTEKVAREKSQKRANAVRLDGGKKEFDSQWGYESLASIKENNALPSDGSLDLFSARSVTLDRGSKRQQDGAYEKSLDRRGSVPVTRTVPHEEDSITMDPPSTPSRIANFFSRKGIGKSNLKRTKSATKLDRKRSTSSNDSDCDSVVTSTLRRSLSVGRLGRRPPFLRPPPEDLPLGNQRHLAWHMFNNRMRSSHSHESLLASPQSMHAIDLSAPDVEIKPLHSSMLGQQHCFQVSTSGGTKYYSCRTAVERQKWIEYLRKTVQPNQEQSRRMDNSLKLWILEAKNIPTKKKYFCELCLDKTLYARTSSKMKGEMLFWGEQFDFSSLPAVETITVNLYREPDKKKKKEKNTLIGSIQIPAKDVSSRQVTERWYSTVVNPDSLKSGKEVRNMDTPQLRIRAHYQSVQILPMDAYKELIQYIKTDGSILVDVLEPLLSVKAKEEIATSMVRILQKLGCVQDFLSDITMSEVDKLDNENLAFRGNSIATKAMEAYMKLVGEKYLQDTLLEFIHGVLETSDDCEVDPMRVPNNTILQRHQNNLKRHCQIAWYKIIYSHTYFPVELRKVFSSLRERCEERKREDMSDNLISACIFLRFLCPAILSPSLFNLMQELPQQRSARNLTLVTKAIQTLANFNKFGAKEEFMIFMNDFVEQEIDSMKKFIRQISTVDEQYHREDFDGYIDLGRELSVLHSMLEESIQNMTEPSEMKLRWLHRIVDDITNRVNNPQSTPLIAQTPTILHGQTPTRLGSDTDNRHCFPEHDVSVSMSDNSYYIGSGSESWTSSQQGLDVISNSQKRHGLANDAFSKYLLSDNVASANASGDFNDRSRLVNGRDTVAPPNGLMQNSAQNYGAVGSEPAMIKTAFTNIKKNYDAGSDTATRTPNRAYDRHRSVGTATPADLKISQLDDYVTFIAQDEERTSVSVSTHAQSTPKTSHVNEQQVTQSWNKMVSAADLVSGEYIDLISFIDGSSGARERLQSAEFSGGDQESIGQLSAIASSGYQSFGYSQSNSPIDPHMTQQQQQQQHPLSFANPLFRLTKVTPRSASRTTRSPSLSSLSSTDSTKRAHHVSRHHCTKEIHQTAVPVSMATCRSLAALSSSGESLENTVQHRPQSSLPTTSPFPSPCPSRISLPPDSCYPERLNAYSELSKSVEFSPPLPEGGDTGMKRTVTDSVLSEACYGAGSGYANVKMRSNGALPQNTVRMGVRSVQHKIQEQEKTKAEYDRELAVLRQQLSSTQAMLQETQQRLANEETTRHQMAVDMSEQLKTNEERHKEKQQQKDTQMKTIIQRLVSVEDNLRQEQEALHATITQKQKVIEVQERRIQSLDAANSRLLLALAQLKERGQLAPSQNGVTTTSSPCAGKTKLMLSSENGQLKSSSC